MLRRRLISAAVIIGLLLAVLWGDFYAAREWTHLGPGVLITLIATLGVMLSASELVYMWRAAGRAVSMRVTMFGTGLLAVGAAMPVWYPAITDSAGWFGGTFLGLFLAICAAALYEVLYMPATERLADRLIHHIFTFGYFSLLLGSVSFHRQLFNDNGFGLCAVLAVIATVKCSDAAAFFLGRLFGKHKLAPRVSAGKTIEGALGAFVGGILGAAIIFRGIVPLVAGIEQVQSWWWIVCYGVILTVAGMLGDLMESIIKRDAACKDSSSWLPGLGGMLDVVDSLIFAAPASCLVWILL